MTFILWIINALLALSFFGAGVMKLSRKRDAIISSGMGWANDFSSTSVKLIGLAEALGALGLILPLATGIASILTPIAAGCLTVLMLGAVVVHIRRHEPATPALVLALVALVSAVLGFLVVL